MCVYLFVKMLIHDVVVVVVIERAKDAWKYSQGW